jgi:hypothetical protein
MKPPLNFYSDSPALRRYLTTPFLWKSSVPAAFYADFLKHGPEKAIKIALIRVPLVPEWPCQAVKACWAPLRLSPKFFLLLMS